MSKRNLPPWVKNNLVAIVVIPLIIGIHWGWYELQQVPALVPQPHNSEMPIIAAFKAYKGKLMENFEKGSESPDTGK